MTTYHVTWEIEIDADEPEDAANLALDIQRDVLSRATVFNVKWATPGAVLPYNEMDIDVQEDV